MSQPGKARLTDSQEMNVSKIRRQPRLAGLREPVIVPAGVPIAA